MIIIILIIIRRIIRLIRRIINIGITTIRIKDIINNVSLDVVALITEFEKLLFKKLQSISKIIEFVNEFSRPIIDMIFRLLRKIASTFKTVIKWPKLNKAPIIRIDSILVYNMCIQLHYDLHRHSYDSRRFI